LIDRRRFIGTLAGGLLASPITTFAQQPTKVVRIGFLGSSAPPPELLGAVRGGLRERGYVEGSNLALEVRWTEGSFDALPALANELARSRVDLILAWATPAALAAKRATPSIPIVFFGVSDPVGSGLVASLARPGGTEDRKGARPDNPAIAAARGRGDSATECFEPIAAECPVLVRRKGCCGS